jgi:hypothetical protein
LGTPHLGVPSQRTRCLSAAMTKDRLADFVCPECQARYKVVHVPPLPRSTARQVSCLICAHALAAADGDDVLKYFLVDRPRSVRTPLPKK